MYENRQGWTHLGSNYAIKKPLVLLNRKIWHKVEIKEPSNSKATEIFKWLEEHKTHCVIENKLDNGITKNVFWFTNEIDATTFKLRWI